MNIPEFSNINETFKFLQQNKSIILFEKKYTFKKADSINSIVDFSDKSGVEIKSNEVEKLNPDLLNEVKVKSVLNTTNIIDSHLDLHLPNLWKKSLDEVKELYLLQEHQMKFDRIITDNVVASTKNMNWKDLGLSYDGKTQALIFDSLIDKNRNPFMFNQYLKGYVKNHSVGMKYVKIQMCVKSEDKYFRDEKDAWEKYINEAVNKEVAEEKGYFFAVTEAKLIEGSAVPLGSNFVTPTRSITENKQDNEAVNNDTSNKQEPSKDTLKNYYYY